MHSNSGNSKSTYILIGAIILVSILIVGGAYFLSTTQQAYKTPAEAPSCHDGAPPLPIMPGCEQGDETPGCTAPDVGYCKAKGNCFECRFSGDNSLKTICPCAEATPTPVQRRICESPNICLPKEQCAPESIAPDANNTTAQCENGLICCQPVKVTEGPTPPASVNTSPTPISQSPTPTVKPTSGLTSTPTTPPVGGPQNTPTPTSVLSTITPKPTTQPTSKQTPAPTLPNAGAETGLYVILGVGAVILLLGLAL